MNHENLKKLEANNVPFSQYTIQVPMNNCEKIALVRSIVQQTFFNYVTRDKKNLYSRGAKRFGPIIIDVISHMVLYENLEEAAEKIYENNVTTLNKNSIIIYYDRACIFEIFFMKRKDEKDKKRRAEYVPTDITLKIREAIKSLDKDKVTAFTTFTIFNS